MRTAAASALVFCLAASSAGCSSGASRTGGSSVAAGLLQDAAGPADAAAPSNPGEPAAEGPIEDCTGRTADQAEAVARARLLAVPLDREGCPSLRVRFWSDGGLPGVSRGWEGSVGPCEESDDGRADRVRAAFTDGDWSCLAGRELERQGHEGAEYEQLASRLEERCGGYDSPVHSGNIVIVVGDGGRVADVRSARGGANASTDTTLRCIRNALRDLAFPCLAGRRVCPDWIIVE
jgi:hypothetical protein